MADNFIIPMDEIDKEDLADCPMSERDINLLQGLAGYGLTLEEIAPLLNMSERTLKRRREKYPVIEQAYQKGRSLAKSNVAKTAYDLATSGKNPGFTAFWLKVHCKWSTTQKLEISNPANVSPHVVMIDQMAPEDREQKLEEMIEQFNRIRNLNK